MPCQEFPSTLAALAPSNTQQFSFGLTRGCNADGTALWIIDFVFRDRPNSTTDFQDRVKLHVKIGAADNAAAKKLMSEG